MSSVVKIPDDAHTPTATSVEISVKGEWVKVAAFQIERGGHHRQWKVAKDS